MRAPQGPGAAGALACELCQAHRAAAAPQACLPSPAGAEPSSLPASSGRAHAARAESEPECLARLGPAPRPPRRLRILCLHGFRQSGSRLRGHWAGLSKRLGDLAVFTFVDAPHALPLYYRGERPPTAPPASNANALPGAPCPRCTAPGAQPACNGFHAPGRSMRAGSMSRGGGREGAVGSDSTSGFQCKRVGSCRGPDSACARQAADSDGAPPRPKRAWLVEPAAEGAAREGGGQGTGCRQSQWQPAPAALDAQQHLRQVEGWPASLALLREALRSSEGPYDGVMGFSQVGRACTRQRHLKEPACHSGEQVRACRQCSGV